MTSTVFKAYDIRGKAPGELDAAFARRLGKVLAHLYPTKIMVVGRDMRTTSPELESALIDGLSSAGVDVVRIGLCSTPMFNFAVGEANGAYGLGIMVTASHNPAEYNGFKLTRGDVRPVGMGSGMEAIRDAMLGEEAFVDAPNRGTVSEDAQVLERYVAHVVQAARLTEAFPEWRVAVDAGNGMNGHVLPALKEVVRNATLVPLFWELDGRFPNHEANPLNVETLEALVARVRRDACALGVAYDGDADRVGFVDETGTPIPGDLLTALFAEEVLRAHPGGKVLYDVRSSWSVAEAVREAGGTPVLCPVGHAKIKHLMRETGAVFGGELSMHFYFQEMWNCESGDFALLLLLKRLQESGKPLSALWKGLRRYVHSGEINFEVHDPKGKIAELHARYADSATEIITIDGIRMEFRDPAHPEQDWWFSVRASNTEPLLRLNLEARTDEAMRSRKEALSKIIQGV